MAIRKVFDGPTVVPAATPYVMNAQQDAAAHIKIIGGPGGGSIVTIIALDIDGLASPALANAVAVPGVLNMVLSIHGDGGPPQNGFPAAGTFSSCLYLPDYILITSVVEGVTVSVCHIIEEG